ncbi:MAG TPA: GGDEF domain-containing protein [Candidatus Acidoferrum sp.]|nr:GGDEF domain-containing protein [Candidatus Acidoferrum sp.]
MWDEILLRRQTLASGSANSVSLLTAMVDVFASANLFQFPLLIEREDLKTLERNAVTDPLTGLHNRRLFSETFEKELNRAKRYAQPLSLVTLDLHRFKEVNDHLGHLRGDDVLRAVASTLRKSLRTSDSAFRLGGDEFALLLPQTDAPQALALSKRIGIIFYDVLRSIEISVDVSLDHGISTFPADGDAMDLLVRIADQRLYRLKHANHDKTSAQTEAPPPPNPEFVPPISSASAATEMPGVRRAVSISDSHPSPSSPSSAAPPAPIEMPRPAPPTESSLAAAVSASSLRIPSSVAVAPAAAPGIEPRPNYAVQRKAERVSMTGTNAYAVLGETSPRRAKVLDLGFGGVALEVDTTQSLPDNFLAILHVPILPPVRVNLKPVWSRPSSEGTLRVGCCFIS